MKSRWAYSTLPKTLAMVLLQANDALSRTAERHPGTSTETLSLSDVL